MKTLTVNQRDVLSILRHSEVPLTVREIADSRAIPVRWVRAALAVLERHGAVERCGVSLSGGATWTTRSRLVAIA